MPRKIADDLPRISDTQNKSAERAAAKLATLKKLAMKRVPKTVKSIQLIGNLVTYSPTPAQKEAILAALVAAVTEVQSRFKERSATAGFELE